MERYHIFKLGLAVIFYAIYCIRPMMVAGTEVDDVNGSTSNSKHNLSDEQYYVYYQGVEGTPGVDFPILSHIPKTSFSCDEMESGYYADLETDCQVFHICEDTKKISFLCPNGTVFQQADLICEWWFKVNCTDAPNLYLESAEQLKDDQTRYKANRRVEANRRVVDRSNHGAVMRMEEHSSVSASRNGQRYDIDRNRIAPSTNRPSKSTSDYRRNQQNTNDDPDARKYQKNNSKAGGNGEFSVHSSKNGGGSVRATTGRNAEAPSHNRANNVQSNYRGGREESKNDVGNIGNQKGPSARSRGNSDGSNNGRSNANDETNSGGNIKIRLQSSLQTVVPDKSGQRSNPAQSTNTKPTRRQDNNGNIKVRLQSGRQTVVRSKDQQRNIPSRNNNVPGNSINEDAGNDKGRTGTTDTVYDNFSATTSRSTLAINNAQRNNNGNIKIRLQTGTQVSGTASQHRNAPLDSRSDSNQGGTYRDTTNSGNFKRGSFPQNENSNSKLHDAEVISSGVQSHSKPSFSPNDHSSLLSRGPASTPSNRFDSNVHGSTVQSPSTSSDYGVNVHLSTPQGINLSYDHGLDRNGGTNQIKKVGFGGGSTATVTQSTTRVPSLDSNNAFGFSINGGVTPSAKSGLNNGFTTYDQANINEKSMPALERNDHGNPDQETESNPNHGFDVINQGAKSESENTVGGNLIANKTDPHGHKTTAYGYSHETTRSTLTPGQSSFSTKQEFGGNIGYSGSYVTSPGMGETGSEGFKATSADSSLQKGDKNNLFGGFTGNNIGLNKKDLVEKKLESSDSDETQITQESASFVKNSANQIRNGYKSTTSRYSNHRDTYSEIKDPKEYKEKYSSTISSVTPQYVTTQTINHGKPFLGSTVGLKIKPKPFENPFFRSTDRIGGTESSNGFSNQGFGTPSSKSPYTYLPKATTSQSAAKSVGSSETDYISAQNDETYYPQEKSTTEFSYIDRDSETTPIIVEKFNIGIANSELPPRNPTAAVTLPIPTTRKFNLGSTATPLDLLPPNKPTPERGNAIVPNAGSLNRGHLVTHTSVFHEPGRERYEHVKTSTEPLANRINVDILKPNQSPSSTIPPPNVNRYYTIGSDYGTSSTPNPLSLPTTDSSHISIPTGLPLLRRGSAVVPSVSHKNVDQGKIKVAVTGGNYEQTTSKPLKKSSEYEKYNGRSTTNSIAGNSLSHSFNTFSTATGGTTSSPIIKATTSAASKHTFSKIGEYRQFSSPRPFTVNGSSDKKLHIDVSSPSESHPAAPLDAKNAYNEASAFGKNILSSTIAPNALFNTGTASFGGATGKSSTEKYGLYQAEVTTTSPRLSSPEVEIKANGQGSPNAPPGCPYSHGVQSTTAPSVSTTAKDIDTSTVSVPSVGSFNDGKSTVKVSPTILPHWESTTKRTVDHATVWGTFSKTTTSAPTNSPFNNFQASKNRTYSGDIASTLKVTAKTTYQPSRVNGQTSPSPIRSTSTPKVYVNDILSNDENSRPFSQNGFFVTKDPFSKTTTQPSAGSEAYQKTPANSLHLGTIKPRPFQLNTITPKSISIFTTTATPKDVASTKPTYIISSAAPFSLAAGGSVTSTTPRSIVQGSQETGIHRVPDIISNSVYDNVDNMIYALMNISRPKDDDYSSENPRPGLIIPPSAGPQTLHSLAVYFANALDGMGVAKEANGSISMNGEEKERLTLLLTKMTMDRYNELFGDKEPDSIEGTTVNSSESASEEIDLQGQHSKNPIQNPEVRQLAKVFTKALADYLDDPDGFRQTLEKVRPTEPPPLPDVETTTNPDDELLNFSDADAKSSYPPKYPTLPSVRPTWGYILALNNTNVNNLDVKNSLNPDENLHQSDSQSFVSQFNSLTSKDKEKVTQSSSEAKSASSLPPNHWTQSPDATKLWRTTLSVNPADINFNFRTTEASITTLDETTEEILPDDTLPSLEQQPHEDVSFQLHSLPKLSLNATQVHGILIDFMNNTKSKEDGKLQRILRKLNTSEDEFLVKMKEIEANPLTRRLILLLISECGQNVTQEIESLSVGGQLAARATHEDSAKPDDDETLTAAPSSYNVGESSSLRGHKQSSSDLKLLVDPSLDDSSEDARALQLLNSLYSIASRFGK